LFSSGQFLTNEKRKGTGDTRCFSILRGNRYENINIKVKEIKPYEQNPRFNDHAVEKVANSIKEFGIKQPLVVDETMFLS